MGSEDSESSSTEKGESSLDIETHSSADVFETLGSETRIEILEALGNPPGEKMSFTELYKAVEIDDSGNFAYHLNRVLGTFVLKEDEQYLLSHAGEQVVGSVQAGTYQAKATVEPAAFGGTCQLCGGELIFEYTQERVRVYCDECGAGRSFPFPPGCLPDYDIEELPAVSARWYRTHVKRVLDRFCPLCAGEMSGELIHGVNEDSDPPEPSLARFSCITCGKQVHLTGATIATFHPVFEGFLFEHGFDTRCGPHSEVWAALDDTTETTHTRDPLSIEVTFTHDGETVTGFVEEDASLTNVERQW
ncbi:helix-turn-helix domain-containing protein [Natronococcus sp. A-GB7]|uniref:winged helix-turn-helix domain-containing protein n=1 Tax=Natronococcus sp. A-GB7 TaxID=3037649 RepID=UPI00241CF92A|nr:helix-turn-helix domain-containing protein [Natronococcus sp. A-GB7]MDG5818396.1 helix-turn-helix domain-containing protein [Natronococcus sp. A-GB7]